MKIILSKPATSANLAAALILVVSAFISARNFPAGALIFTILCYFTLSLAKGTNLWLGYRRRPPRLLYNFLSTSEKDVYRRFSVYIHQPKLAFFFSTTLHWIRLAAFPWIAFCLWQGCYYTSIALVLFTILSSGTISTMYPDLYFEDAVKRGNQGAAEMLHTLRRVQDMLAPSSERHDA